MLGGVLGVEILGVGEGLVVGSRCGRTGMW